MQKKYLALIIALIITLTTTVHVSAISPSPSPSPSPSTKPSQAPEDMTDVANENIKKRLQESLETVNKESSVLQISSARAYIGVVKDVINGTLILEDKDGKKDIKLKEDTVILRTPGNKPIKVDSIRIDDYIIAIGYPGEANTLIGRRLIVSIDPIKSPSKTSGIGIINKIGKSSLTLQIGDHEQNIDLTSKTVYKSTVGTIELTDLAVGDTLIYTAAIDDDKALTATILMRTKTASVSQ